MPSLACHYFCCICRTLAILWPDRLNGSMRIYVCVDGVQVWRDDARNVVNGDVPNNKTIIMITMTGRMMTRRHQQHDGINSNSRFVDCYCHQNSNFRSVSKCAENVCKMLINMVKIILSVVKMLVNADQQYINTTK